MLNTYEKRAIARITRNKTDEGREAIGADDMLARDLIAHAKIAKLDYATKAVANLTRDLAEWQIEKEIWENVEGLPPQIVIEEEVIEEVIENNPEL